jgi:hypothetical protein
MRTELGIFSLKKKKKKEGNRIERNFPNERTQPTSVTSS